MDTNSPPQSTALLRGGQEALARGAWKEARSAFEEVLGRRDPDPSSGVEDRPVETAEVLFGLGSALWWLGETREAVRCWERAYAAFRSIDPVQATNVALQLGFIYQANLGNVAASAGWAAHAARLVDQFDLEPMRGWVLLIKADNCFDPEESQNLTNEARRLAVDFGDRDLELCALSQLGTTLIEGGRIGEGVPLIDEAMAGALAGEGKFDTVVFTSCQMIHSCNRCADFQRVVQWVRAADRFIKRYGCPFLNATCRANYGGVLFATGDWEKAEVELRAALELSGDAMPPVRAEALARLAELRLAQGRIREAERLVAGFEDHEATVAVCARIQMLRGNLALATTTLERRLGAIGEGRLESALLLELLGEVEIGQGRGGEAAKRGRKLAELGGTFGCRVMVAHGERLLGHALAAAGDPAPKRHLDAALGEFARLEMPFETARTRLLIAQVETLPEVAQAEALAALAVFESLGASESVGATTALVRQIETMARERATDSPGLSRREEEVLRLVAQGLSNRDIADRLVLSKHTVHRHVSSILTKLDLSSRTAAAAYAAKHDLLP
jgi:DNA-binding CsgD family transcriptional regulator/tetratricopeptide (TPR) repeat protein